MKDEVKRWKLTRWQRAIQAQIDRADPEYKFYPIRDKLTESDNRFLERYESEAISATSIDMNPFDAPDAEVPETDFEDKPFTEQISEEQTENRLEFARWLFKKKWKLKTRNQALRFVTLILENEVIRADIRERIAQENRLEFDKWIEQCNGGKLESTREDQYLAIRDSILNLLKGNKLALPTRDLDGFVFQLAMVEQFRKKVIYKCTMKDKYLIEGLCKRLRENEQEGLNEKNQ